MVVDNGYILEVCVELGKLENCDFFIVVVRYKGCLCVFFNVINLVQLFLLFLDYLFCCDILGFRGLGLFCLDNKIIRIGLVFFFNIVKKRCYVLINKVSLNIQSVYFCFKFELFFLISLGYV